MIWERQHRGSQMVYFGKSQNISLEFSLLLFICVGQPLANIIHPYESELIETLYAPVDGRIFFIHNDPLTYANTVVIKLVR